MVLVVVRFDLSIIGRSLTPTPLTATEILSGTNVIASISILQHVPMTVDVVGFRVTTDTGLIVAIVLGLT